MSKPGSDWLSSEISFPIIREVSRAVYNYFNYDDPYTKEESEARIKATAQAAAEAAAAAAATEKSNNRLKELHHRRSHSREEWLLLASGLY
ncbi:MAG: hypothetical protein H6668_05735 [Ardenticatenaceae bacterium]|nr:hypothetical protein [Ardenticatenaceae bacterium]